MRFPLPHELRRSPFWAGAAFLLLSIDLCAQEAVRPSIARQREAQPTSVGNYNLKAGPVLFNFSAGFGIESVDNVRLTDGTTAKKEADLIFTPNLGIDVRWQFTKLNAFKFRSNISYSKYLDNPELDTNALLLSPDSELSFDVRMGDFKLTFRDQFSYQQDPLGAGNLSGTARFGRFTNDAGVTLLWDLNDLILRLGYDRVNLQVIGSGDSDPNSNLSRVTDQISGLASVTLTDSWSMGIEGTGAASAYPDSPQNDSTRVTCGPFLNLQLTPYTRVYLGGGYVGTTYKQPVTSVQEVQVGSDGISRVVERSLDPGDGNSLYAALNLFHRLNRYFSDQISIGRESQLGLLAQETRSDFIRILANWQLGPALSLASNLYYEQVEQSTQLAADSYERWGAIFSTQYRVNRHLNAGLSYQFTQKAAPVATLDYSQNRLGLTLSYQF